MQEGRWLSEPQPSLSFLSFPRHFWSGRFLYLQAFLLRFPVSNDTSFRESLYFPLAPGNPVLTHKGLVLFPQNCHC